MSSKSIKRFKILSLLLMLFIAADTCYSFYQYYQLPLDGDIAPIVAPSEHYSNVLEDPFGISVLKNKERYAATNRYFTHITMVGYYKEFYALISPIFKDKVKALYFISALFNTITHLLLLFVLAIYACGHLRFWKTSFLLAVAIIIPFFQVNGFYESIGLIDQSVTYTFFYALPMALLLLYFLPFYLAFYHKKPIAKYFKSYMYLIWFLLAIYLSFSGSQIAPLVIIICPTIIVAHLYFSFKKSNSIYPIQNIFNLFQSIPKTLLFFLGFILLLSTYSFYIGRFNIENGDPIALSERYLKLAKGLPKFLTFKITFVLIALLLSVNVGVVKKLNPKLFSSQTFKVILIALVLCLVYVILLPLGGYRPYRPWIVRYDTFLPVTIVLILLITTSSYYLLTIQSFPKQLKRYYVVFLLSTLMVFQISDGYIPKHGDNQCQKDALYTIAASENKVVKLTDDCTILSWFIMGDPLYSKDIGKMLYYWGISSEEITFYQTNGQ